MSKPTVTIITVVLNNVTHIERTIRSVLNQTSGTIQYLIVDGKSTDGTLDIIDKYRGQLTLISEHDNGIYEAMNKGLCMSTGDIVGILNSGDWYEPNTVELILMAAEKNPAYCIYHGLLRYVDGNDTPILIAGHHHSFLKKGMIEHPTCFIRKEVYHAVGYFDSGYASAADYDFMLRVLKQGMKFYLLEQVLANFSSGGISGSYQGAFETLNIRYKFGFISAFKKNVLLAYWWLKTHV